MNLAFLLLSILTGFGAVRLAWPNGLRLCRHDILRFALGAGFGLAISSVVVFIADAAFGGVATLVAAADLLVFAAVVAAYIVFRRGEPCPLCAAKPGDAPPWWLSAAAAVAIVSAIATFVVFTSANPLGEWDAWAIWNNHARFLASGANWKQLYSPYLVWSVQDYPLLTPGAIANAWMASGSTSILVPAIVSAVFLAGTAGVLFGVLDLVRNRAQALIAVTALFGAAAISHLGASQYADIPAGYFYIAAAGLLAISDAVPADRHSLWLAGAAAGCAAWTKNEGLVFVGALVAARLYAGRRKDVFWILAGAAPVLAVALWFKFAIAPANYLFTGQQPLSARLGDVSRYMAVAVAFGKRMFSFGDWLIPPVLVAAAYLWLMGRSNEPGPGRATASWTLLLMTVAYAGVYVSTTMTLEWQIETSLSRVLMQLWPLSVLVFFLHARAPVAEEKLKTGRHKSR